MTSTSTRVPVTAAEARAEFRENLLAQPTSGMAPGFVQANLAILPRESAFEFLLFCQRNPKPCPVIDVIEAGSVEPVISAPGADIRTDVPRYLVYRDGVVTDELLDLKSIWQDDLVSFLLGCSFSFEHALIENGITLPHWETDKNVAMFKTNLQTTPAGPFAG
ncbi:MAG TPA: DUF1445 domain-containing protein, partial [Dehalococcoidia bacterium]|nr:DUF1445 domain-containing protein [Dehalococcoidia bacterium]